MFLLVSKLPTINQSINLSFSLSLSLFLTHTHLEIFKSYGLSNWSNPCIITRLAMSTIHINMLRMTHLGNKLLVLLVQISSGSYIVSPYSQPALLSKPGNKARMQDHSDRSNPFHLNPPSSWEQVIQNPTLAYRHIREKDHQSNQNKE
jgi:hypothetical protein